MCIRDRCQGRGGSMHIADFSVGMLGANGVVGGGYNLATGAATPVKEEMDFFLQFTHPLQIISRYGPFEDIGQRCV